MNLSTLIGLSSISLLLCVVLLRLLLLFKLKTQYIYFILAVFFIISFMSFSGDTINQYFRGIFNDLSISSIILISYFISMFRHSRIQTASTLNIIALAGVCFYPLALGFGPTDPYAWGYFNNLHGYTVPLIFIMSLLGLISYAFYKKDLMLLICLVSSIIAFQFGLLESRNLWDYLLDPVIWIFALYGTFISFFSQIKFWKNTGKHIQSENL